MTTPAKPASARKPAAPRATTPRRPQDRKPPAAKPTEPAPEESIEIDPVKEREAAERRAELLEDIPELRPAARFRLRHRNDFHNLVLEAKKSGAFEGGSDDSELDFDMDKPEDIVRFQKLQEFVVSIDEWAETIAEDIDAYTLWSEGKTEETFIALFVEYREALGE
ncbi:hypothetical protein [Microbacterium lacus]|uniref:hypothetical protein n=1 Tax=Microbacterium lacus TaxID=415217 RepID=UPI000C2BAF24|nr:hypothetical protein [Microbacterium lacus]